VGEPSRPPCLGAEPAWDVEPERLAWRHGPQARLQVRQAGGPQRALPLGPDVVEDHRGQAQRLDALRDFLAQGYTRQNALEVVLGIGTYTMSTLANRLTGAPVDDQLAAFAWHPEAA
jgi:alkylhydroperoxidase family enzyme